MPDNDDDFELEGEQPTRPEIVRENLANLIGLFNRKADAADVYKADVLAVSTRSGYTTKAINALVKAECGDTVRKTKHDAEEIAEILEESARQRELLS